MNFNHEFAADLEQIDLFDRQNKFALGRFGDGETALLQMRPIPTADGWSVPTFENPFRQELAKALRCTASGWHVGLSCPCCYLNDHRWLMENCGAPDERRTYSNLFVNANYDTVLKRIKEERWLERCAIVANPDGCKERPDYCCPDNVVQDLWGIEQIVKRLQGTDRFGAEGRPILLCCGPAGAIIAHKYWTTTDHPETIVDIGSILDPLLRGRISRGYHDPTHPNRSRVCRWTVVNGLP